MRMQLSTVGYRVSRPACSWWPLDDMGVRQSWITKPGCKQRKTDREGPEQLYTNLWSILAQPVRQDRDTTRR